MGEISGDESRLLGDDGGMDRYIDGEKVKRVWHVDVIEYTCLRIPAFLSYACLP